MSTRKSSKQKQIDELQKNINNLVLAAQVDIKRMAELEEKLQAAQNANEFHRKRCEQLDLQLATVRIEYANMHQLRVNEADYNSRQLNVIGNLSMAMNKILDKFGETQ